MLSRNTGSSLPMAHHWALSREDKGKAGDLYGNLGLVGGRGGAAAVDEARHISSVAAFARNTLEPALVDAYPRHYGLVLLVVLRNEAAILGGHLVRIRVGVMAFGMRWEKDSGTVDGGAQVLREGPPLRGRPSMPPFPWGYLGRRAMSRDSPKKETCLLPRRPVLLVGKGGVLQGDARVDVGDGQGPHAGRERKGRTFWIGEAALAPAIRHQDPFKSTGLLQECLCRPEKGKFERLKNFLLLPSFLERTICFGALACLDALHQQLLVAPDVMLQAGNGGDERQAGDAGDEGQVQDPVVLQAGDAGDEGQVQGPVMLQAGDGGNEGQAPLQRSISNKRREA
ncbi:hypothetical protein GGTG_04711 [Gaeumannomyces tritici R3-111a-1]|uniref:Uncharacterized protein n=1 Tax=Gaeumannomyces tritici (strain R3-111a-1) TaxID=644352 RepID=J3NTW2_GAET3|nr:hypothetical protein GGTG_04711 [Gaeumannomyces tritici R3-111a-1]EJT79627.1 hypothetical protein GGTG_04711 [Gaeumannomyces tritici R3-111a-1]